jgi:RNA polymerase sigma-70 factor (ECF subfamily)
MERQPDKPEHGGETASNPSPSGLSDRELVHRAREGETRFFDELVARYAHRVHRLTYKILRHEQDAEDAMQDAFLSAYRSLPRFQEKSTFSTWLYRVATNAALMRLRKRREGMVSIEQPSSRSDQQTTLQIADWARSPVDDLMDTELRAALEEAIGDLSEDLQAVFLLREQDKLSNQQTADELKLTVPAVKSRLHRARVELRNRLGEFFSVRSGGDDPQGD